MFELLHGAVSVVGVGLNHQCTASRAVCFVGYLFQLGSVSRGLAQGAFDIIERHVSGACLFYRSAHAGRVFVALGLFNLNGNKSHKLTEKLCLLGVSLALNMFELSPLAVSCHKITLYHKVKLRKT